MIEIYISKGVLPLVHEAGYAHLKKGDNVLDMQEAHDLEQDMWNKYQELGKSAPGRAAASLSRNLATAIECTKHPDEPLRVISTVLDGKWDDKDAVETHI